MIPEGATCCRIETRLAYLVNRNYISQNDPYEHSAHGDHLPDLPQKDYARSSLEASREKLIVVRADKRHRITMPLPFTISTLSW